LTLFETENKNSPSQRVVWYNKKSAPIKNFLIHPTSSTVQLFLTNLSFFPPSILDGGSGRDYATASKKAGSVLSYGGLLKRTILWLAFGFLILMCLNAPAALAMTVTIYGQPGAKGEDGLPPGGAGKDGRPGAAANASAISSDSSNTAEAWGGGGGGGGNGAAGGSRGHSWQ
jgi:hypothetical protein